MTVSNRGGFGAMSASDSKSVVRQFIEHAWIGKDVDAVLTYYAPDFIYHNPAMEEMPPGLDGVRVLLAGFHAAFPDADYRIDALVGEEDLVAVLYSWSGTNRGALGPMPATERSATATGAIFCRVANGRIVEQWDVDDRLSVMQQLGLVPAA
jgi:steroid delta-isomerase-like uncharacterized protein